MEKFNCAIENRVSPCLQDHRSGILCRFMLAVAGKFGIHACPSWGLAISKGAPACATGSGHHLLEIRRRSTLGCP